MTDFPTPDSILLGILAVHNQIISADQLRQIIREWTGHRDSDFGRFLVVRTVLTEEEQAVLKSLARIQLSQHGNDIVRICRLLGNEHLFREVELQIVPSYQPETQPFARVASGHVYGDSPVTGYRRFQQGRLHARGSFGEVFVAVDCELDREVALKKLDAAHCEITKVRARFLEEAKLTASLEHPGIVPIYGMGVDEHNHPYYAMRLVAGRTLGDALDEFHRGEHDALSFDKLLRRFIDVCYTVAYAHSRHVLHRDLKPSNVLVGEFRQTFVIDWGLAKITTNLETDDSHHVESLANMLTHDGSPVGTPAYMSPEQAAGRLSEIDERSDVYCLGATLYHLLTGEPPVRARSLAEVTEIIGGARYPRPCDLNGSVPAALEIMCLKAMAVRREDRYSSALDLAQDLESWLSEKESQLSQELEQLMREQRNVLAKSEVESELRALVREVFFPPCRPSRPGYEFFDFYEAHGNESALLDYIELTDGTVAVVVANVLGIEHAAETLWVSKLWGQIRLALAAATRATQVHQIVGALDRQMATEKVLLEGPVFVRLALVILDPNTHEVAICNAGYPTPLLCGNDGSVKEFGELESGPLIGLPLPDDILHTHASFTLAPGESLVLYSSGLSEVQDAYETRFGVEGIRDAAVPDGPTALGNAILTRFRLYAKEPHFDDVCLVCLGRAASYERQ